MHVCARTLLCSPWEPSFELPITLWAVSCRLPCPLSGYGLNFAMVTLLPWLLCPNVAVALFSHYGYVQTLPALFDPCSSALTEKHLAVGWAYLQRACAVFTGLCKEGGFVSRADWSKTWISCTEVLHSMSSTLVLVYFCYLHYITFGVAAVQRSTHQSKFWVCGKLLKS